MVEYSGVVEELEEIGVGSVYHNKNEEAHGSETSPTFFLHRNLEKPYHIDYVFCSIDLMEKSQLFIGKADQWLQVSDHMPLSIEWSS
jgi:endonuclease/exonuclease/phosphatase family metal-dependent hydrolase